ncbi:uncharacterized protein LOC144116173 [Amblyomma americanum]
MDWRKLRKTEMVLICGELGIDCGKSMTKRQVVDAIQEGGFEDEEIVECWEDIKNKAEEEERKRQYELELESKRLEVRLAEAEAEKAKAATPNVENNLSSKPAKMKDLLSPFKMGEDIGLCLVNFERTCEKNAILRTTWTQHLLTVLPCEAADVLARLTKAEADDYDRVKATLLKKYRLSADAFRRRFRNSAKQPTESYPDFAYNLKANLVEWLRAAEVYEDRDKVVEHICIEQFYNCLNEETRLWVQDRPEKKSLERAAELAEEFQARRDVGKENVRAVTKPYRNSVNRPWRREDRATPTKGDKGTHEGEHGKRPVEGDYADKEKKQKERARAFEVRMINVMLNSSRMSNFRLS